MKFIKSLLPFVDNLNIFDDKIIETLNRIRKGGAFPSILYYNDFISYLKENNKIPNGIIDDEFNTCNKSIFLSPSEGKLGNLLIKDSEAYESCLGYESYLERKSHLGPIITKSSIPDIAKVYFNELRELCAMTGYSCILSCYAFYAGSLLKYAYRTN